MKMQKKIAIVLIISAYILCTLMIGWYISLNTRNKTYTKAKYDTASLQEKEKLDYFYEGSIPISKGKYFDMRYIYYDGKLQGGMRVDVVKKVEENIKIDEIGIYNKKGDEVLYINLNKDTFLNPEFPNKDKVRNSLIWTLDDINYYGYLFGHQLFLIGAMYEGMYSTPPEKYKDLKEITIKMKINGYIETHKLVFDRKESLKTLLKVNDWKHDNKRETRLIYLSEYYGLLFTENYEQWKQEIELLMKEDVSTDLNWSVIFNLPIFYIQQFSKQQLQEYVDLSDKDFETYFNMVIEKELIDKDYLYEVLLR